ncbi:MAG: NERD domain-containing protein, partial [Nocardioidaceae bacterium]
MPILVPPEPTFVNSSEQKVWEALRDQLAPGDALVTGLRISDRRKDHEIDLAVAFEGGGVVVVEVKGSKVWCDEEGWWIERHGNARPIHPVTQAREGLYALREWVTGTPRWG